MKKIIIYNKGRLPFGTKNKSKQYSKFNGDNFYLLFESCYIQPKGKFYKRQANKRVRKSNNLMNGNQYKKVYGWFQWN